MDIPLRPRQSLSDRSRVERARAYTGAGARNTPAEICALFKRVAFRLADEEWTLRSGCAQGADSAFASGAEAAGARPELYLPWPFFGEHHPDNVTRSAPQREAYAIAERLHPFWENLSSAARSLHARNVHEIIGRDVTQPQPSQFLICWTASGAVVGGTGQAIRIAHHYEVPVINAALPANRQRLEEYVR